MVKFYRVAVSFCAIASLLLIACGGNNVDLQGTIGEQASATVTVAEGGTVTLPSGAAQIVIPAGALAADTEITLNTLDVAGLVDEDELGSYVFDFGPDGTTFLQKVEISLKSGGVPSGMEANLAWLDGDKWTKVPGSKLEGGMVVGEIDHFTKFVIYFTEKEVIITTDDPVCKDLDFEPCGGDPVGIWEIEAYCMQPRTEMTENPWVEQFPECGSGNSSYIVDMDWQGEIEVRADNTSVADFDVIINVNIVLKDACLEAMGQGYVAAQTMCNQIATQYQQDEVDVTVTYSAGKCTITAPQETQNGNPQESTWEVVGNTIISDGETNHGQEFCIEGNRFILKSSEDEDIDDDGIDDITYVDYIVLKRK